MTRIAGAVLYAGSLLALVLAIAFQRLSFYLPLMQVGGEVPEGASIYFPTYGWMAIGLGLVGGIVLMVLPGLKKHDK